MRTRGAVLVVVSIVTGCTRATTPSPMPPPASAPAPKTPPDTASIVDVIAALELVSPGGVEVWVNDGPAASACESAGFPEALPAATAAELGPYSPGARLAIVHPAGIAEPTIVVVRCHAPEEPDEPGWAALELSVSAPSRPRALGLESESYLMVAGLRLNPKAQLQVPAPTTEITATVRAALLAVAEDETRHLADQCAEDSETNDPVTPLTDAALQELVLRPVAGRDGRSTFASFAVERCEQTTVFGVLLDPKGDVAEQWVTNNSMEVLWITDLDGDGDDELGMHATWLEDGMEELFVAYRHDGLWQKRTLYEFEGA